MRPERVLTLFRKGSGQFILQQIFLPTHKTTNFVLISSFSIYNTPALGQPASSQILYQKLVAFLCLLRDRFHPTSRLDEETERVGNESRAHVSKVETR